MNPIGLQKSIKRWTSGVPCRAVRFAFRNGPNTALYGQGLSRASKEGHKTGQGSTLEGAGELH